MGICAVRERCNVGAYDETFQEVTARRFRVQRQKETRRQHRRVCGSYQDQFKEDEVVRLSYSQIGKRKRHGLAISDMPDTVTQRYTAALAELRRALPLAKTPEEANAIRQRVLGPIPGREKGARRMFVGRDYDGQSQVTLSDTNGKPRPRLQVDTAGNASIVFLDENGRVVKSITP
jgi:hypothetical protein